MKTTMTTIITVAASILFGCGAAVAIASSAAVSQVAPSLRTTTQAAPLEVVRLQPVVVTISKEGYERARTEATELARANAARKVTRG